MYDPWQQWRPQPWQPQPYRVSTGATFTFRQHQEWASWAEAVKFALHLRVTGQCHTKPRVTRRRDDVVADEGRWQVSWIPAHHVSWNAAAT